MEAGWLVESNKFESALQGVYLNGGRENTIVSNTFVNCSVGVGWAVHRPCNNNSAETACFGGFLKQLDELQWLKPPRVGELNINVQTQPCTFFWTIVVYMWHRCMHTYLIYHWYLHALHMHTYYTIVAHAR